MLNVDTDNTNLKFNQNYRKQEGHMMAKIQLQINNNLNSNTSMPC